MIGCGVDTGEGRVKSLQLGRSSASLMALVLPACVASTPQAEPAASASSAPSAAVHEEPGGRGLAPEPIRRVMMDHLPDFARCADLDEATSGSLSLLFSIAPDGHVESASIGQSLGSPVIEACMLKVLQGLEFPSAEKPTNVSFPFLFRPKR